MLFLSPLVPEASAVIPVGCCSPACCTGPLSHPHCTPLPGHTAHVLCNAATRCSQVEQRKHNEKCSAGLIWFPHSKAGNSSGSRKISQFFFTFRCKDAHTSSSPVGTHLFAARAMLELREPHATSGHQHMFLQLLL